MDETLRNKILDAKSELACAIGQVNPSVDDKILTGHMETAHDILAELLGMRKLKA